MLISKSPPHFSGVIFWKVLGIELFYFIQFVFRGKQPYKMNYFEIHVGVVPHLVHLTENSPITKQTLSSDSLTPEISLNGIICYFEVFKIFSNFNFYSIFFSTLWAENVPTQSWRHLGVYFVPYNLPKNLKLNYHGGGSPSLHTRLILENLEKLKNAVGWFYH